MGVYDSISISTGVSIEQWTSTLADFLDSFDDIFASTSSETVDSVEYTGVEFSINDTTISGFVGWNASEQRHKYFRLNNGDILLMGGARQKTLYMDGVDAKVYDDTGCTVVSIGDTHFGFEFMLADVGETKIVGYYEKPNNYKNFVDISSLTFEGVSDVLRVACTYTNMFPYEANSGTLDFLAQAYFVNNSVRRYTSKALKECSTVILLSTVSLPTPLNNHLAIGAHCIVPLDDEED